MEVLRALAAVVDRPAAVSDRLWELLELPARPDAAAHTDLFTFELPPYASVYLGQEGMLGGEARDRVAGFFRALSVVPPAEPDHLVVLLHAAADLAQAEAAAVTPHRVAQHRRARAALLREHMLPWLPAYLDAVTDTAAEPYRSWAVLLDQAVRRHADELGTGNELPAHLAASTGLPDPRRDGPEDFVTALLVPARTGMILTRRMLAHAARELGVGLRIGERRYVLAHLLDQAPAPVLAWLAERATQSAEGHATTLAWTGPSATSWHERAVATAALLREVADEAALVTESLTTSRTPG